MQSCRKVTPAFNGRQKWCYGRSRLQRALPAHDWTARLETITRASASCVRGAHANAPQREVQACLMSSRPMLRNVAHAFPCAKRCVRQSARTGCGRLRREGTMPRFHSRRHAAQQPDWPASPRSARYACSQPARGLAAVCFYRCKAHRQTASVAREAGANGYVGTINRVEDCQWHAPRLGDGDQGFAPISVPGLRAVRFLRILHRLTTG